MAASRRRKRAAQRSPLLSALARLGAMLLLVWAVGFIWFTGTTPRPAGDDLVTDGIVVLTGDTGRIARGVQLLRMGRAKRMLISGVSPLAGKRSLARAAGAPERLFACCVDLGFQAIDTRSNAEETAAWAKRHGYRSLRLVTSDYHIRRARLELEAELPEARVTVDPVPARDRSPRLMLREYHKYLLRLAARTREG
ncbi:MAG: YdcF family protein [Sphingomonadaceae bacterium]|nr:YdcF family protein [Sphingomonadaceae bacterium]